MSGSDLPALASQILPTAVQAEDGRRPRTERAGAAVQMTGASPVRGCQVSPALRKAQQQRRTALPQLSAAPAVSAPARPEVSGTTASAPEAPGHGVPHERAERAERPAAPGALLPRAVPLGQPRFPSSFPLSGQSPPPNPGRIPKRSQCRRFANFLRGLVGVLQVPRPHLSSWSASSYRSPRVR